MKPEARSLCRESGPNPWCSRGGSSRPNLCAGRVGPTLGAVEEDGEGVEGERQQWWCGEEGVRMD